MPTSDPFYGTSAVIIDRFIGRARNELVRMAIGPSGNMDRFPELRYNTTIGPTVAASNTIARPSAFIYLHRLTKQESSVAPSSWASIREFHVEFKNEVDFVYLSKDSSVGYATIWTRMGNNIAYYPTTTSTYVDYFHGYGLQRETLSASGSAFLADEFWDEPTIMLAAARIQQRRGWLAQSRELMDSVKEYLSNTADITALEALGQVNSIHVESAGSIDRSRIYGRGR